MIDVPELVKDALRSGNYLLYYVITVCSNGIQEYVIDNENLVYESVSINERMCSTENIKFGLCEGSMIEFQYFGFPNIRGKRINVSIDVQYRNGKKQLVWHKIPMGWFDVEKCSRQASTGIFKATCVNKLKSEYLDADATEKIKEIVADGESGVKDKISLHTLLGNLLDGYSIERTTISTGEATSGSSDYGFNVDTVPYSNSYGTTSGYWACYHVSVPIVYAGSELNKDDFYALKVYAKKIYDYILNKLPNLKSNGSRTKINDEVMTLREMVENYNYFSSFSFGGDVGVHIGSSTNTIGKLCDLGNEYTTDYMTNASRFSLDLPVMVETTQNANPTVTDSIMRQMKNLADTFLSELQNIGIIYKQELSDIEKYRITSSQVEKLSNITLRALQSAVYELNAQFGQLDRETDLFSGVSLNGKRLLPSYGLYPADSLYPDGAVESSQKRVYSKLWTDNIGEQRFRHLIVNYKGLDENNKEVTKTIQKTINEGGNTDYDIGDNWLLKNIVWSDEDVEYFADNLVLAMKNLKWFPFEMWCVGLPYLETGDEIEITSPDGTYTSYILQRTLNGIQNLQDTYINGTLDIF